MTIETDSNHRISNLESRVRRLEQIILNNDDILHANFDGYEDLSPEEETAVDEALQELDNNSARSIDAVLRDLE